MVVGAFLASAPTLCTAGIRIDYPALMQSTVEGLIASQLPDGLFPYGYDFLADEPLEPGRLSPENLIRQAGMASVLADYYQRTHDPRLREPNLHLLSALGRHSLPLGKSRVQRWIERAHLLSIPYGRWRLQTASCAMVCSTSRGCGPGDQQQRKVRRCCDWRSHSRCSRNSVRECQRRNPLCGAAGVVGRGAARARNPGGGFRW